MGPGYPCIIQKKKNAAKIFGEWNDSLHNVAGDVLKKASASLLWISTKHHLMSLDTT